MDPFLWLLTLCVAMFIGSFLAGNLPLMFVMQPDTMKMVSAYGAGLLVGTALIVVIPEGIETVYSAHKEVHNSTDIHGALDSAAVLNATADAHSTGDDDEHDEGEHISFLVGISLTFGFGIMFLIEEFTRHLAGNSHSLVHQHDHYHHQPNRYQTSTGSPAHSAISLHTIGTTTSLPSPARHSSSTLASFIGLLIHCAADGISLGAASSGSHAQLQFVVFLAILLHKAPSAFGLVTFLMSTGAHSRRTIRHYLLIFSAAAPLSALFTALVLNVISLDSTSTLQWAGILLLFSGGSFLYVAACHILPEVRQSFEEHPHSPTTEVSPSSKPDRTRINILSTLVIVAGLLSPLLLSLGHEH